MTSNKCKKQYYKFKSKSFEREEQRMQENVQKHFESEHHSGFRDGFSAILVDKTDGSNPNKRETF